MFQGICADILDAKWTALAELDFPLNAKKIAAADCLNENLRQFFFAEINHYSRQVLNSLTINANISPELSVHPDSDAIANILYDWVEFAEEETYNLLKFAIETEIFFLISPAKCLTNFLFKSNPNNETADEISERQIENIINELEFISDKQGILNTLKGELAELTNVQKTITANKLINIANDIVFNTYRKQSIEDFLLPCQHYLEFSANENIPVDFIELFLQERDLAGVLTEFKNYATANDKQTINYEELYNEIGKLTGKLPETAEENIPAAEESLPEMEENIPAGLDLAEESNGTTEIEEIAEPDVIEEVIEEELDTPAEFSENEAVETAEEEIIELPEGEIAEEIEDNAIETVDFEDNSAMAEEATSIEDIQIEEEIVELPGKEIAEEVVDLEDNSDVTGDELNVETEEFETTEELSENLPTADFIEEVNEEDLAEFAMEEEPEEVIIENEEVAEIEDIVSDEFESVEAQIEEEPVSEEENIEANEAVDEVVVPEDFEEFAEAVEMEVDNTIAEMEAEEAIAEAAVSESPKVAPVAAPPTPAMQEVMANSSNINSKMAEMRSNYINSKVAEMRTLGKTLFEIEHNYLEMEAEYVTKILNLLKE